MENIYNNKKNKKSSKNFSIKPNFKEIIELKKKNNYNNSKKKNNKNRFQFLIIKINITTKVIKSGKKQSINIILLSGNGKGLLGLGVGKSYTIETAFEKAKLNSLRNIFKVPISKAKSIFHTVVGKNKKTSVLILPKVFGIGVKASPLIYCILKMVGIQNVCCKQIGSTNKLNVVYAIVNALKKLETNKDFAYNKNLYVNDLLRRIYF